MKNLKVIFMGTPEFSVPILLMLIEKYNVIGVVTQPDRLVGRKKVLTPSPIKKIALENDIQVLTPLRLRNEYEDVINLNPDIIVTCAFGQIVPSEILKYPKYGCINVHASLLPKYRGGAPIQRSIMAGEDKTGITIMYMNEGLDTGDIISQQEVIIEQSDNFDTLSKKMMEAGVNLLEKTLPSIIDNTCKRIKQNDDKSVYAPIIKREDEKIDFNKTSVEIFNHIRALSSIPGAYALLDNKIVKIYSSRIGKNTYPNESNGQIVKIYDDGIGISTKDSEIIITDIKIEGKKRTSVKDYLNGVNWETLIGKRMN